MDACGRGPGEDVASQPLQLPTGYYLVHPLRTKDLRSLKLFRDWVVEAAWPFRDTDLLFLASRVNGV
jgi:hypothetical protein